MTDSSDAALLLSVLLGGGTGGGGIGGGNDLLKQLEEAERRQERLAKQVEMEREKALMQGQEFEGDAVDEDDEYEELKEMLDEITERMIEIGGPDVTCDDLEEQEILREEYAMLQRDFEEYNAQIQNTTKWKAENAGKERERDMKQSGDNLNALKVLRRHLPVNIRHLSEKALSETVSPTGHTLDISFVRRFKRTVPILEILRMDPLQQLKKIHPSVLEKYSTRNLCLIERRALQAHLSVIKDDWQSDKAPLADRRWRWYEDLKAQLEVAIQQDGNNGYNNVVPPVDYFKTNYGWPDADVYEQDQGPATAIDVHKETEALKNSKSVQQNRMLFSQKSTSMSSSSPNLTTKTNVIFADTPSAEQMGSLKNKFENLGKQQHQQQSTINSSYAIKKPWVKPTVSNTQQQQQQKQPPVPLKPKSSTQKHPSQLSTVNSTLVPPVNGSRKSNQPVAVSDAIPNSTTQKLGSLKDKFEQFGKQQQQQKQQQSSVNHSINKPWKKPISHQSNINQSHSWRKPSSDTNKNGLGGLVNKLEQYTAPPTNNVASSGWKKSHSEKQLATSNMMSGAAAPRSRPSHSNVDDELSRLDAEIRAMEATLQREKTKGPMPARTTTAKQSSFNINNHHHHHHMPLPTAPSASGSRSSCSPSLLKNDELSQLEEEIRALEASLRKEKNHDIVSPRRASSQHSPRKHHPTRVKPKINDEVALLEQEISAMKASLVAQPVIVDELTKLEQEIRAMEAEMGKKSYGHQNIPSPADYTEEVWFDEYGNKVIKRRTKKRF